MKGHIRKRGNSYVVVVELPRDPATGKRRQRWHSVKGNKRDAERALREILMSIDNGMYTKPKRISFGALMRQWLSEYVSIHATPRTLESYSSVVNRHIIPSLGAIPLMDLEPQYIQGYYAKALKSGRADGKGGLSARSVLYQHRIIAKALGYAVKMGIAVRNVADVVTPPRVARVTMATLSPKEVNRFLDVAKESVHYVFFSTLLYTGLRRGELLALRWRNLDLDKGSLTVVETGYRLGNGEYVIKEPKTASSRRTISLSPALVELLKKYRIDQELLRIQMGISLDEDDFVFTRYDGTPLYPNAVTHAFQRIIKRAGLKHVRLHDLRHTHATLMLKAGVHPKVVSERLGHSNIGITLDTYSHVLPGIQEAAAERFDKVVEEVVTKGNKEGNVCKMFADGKEVESRPCRSRTCDTLIKSHGVLV
ncbi:tyrosine-type recombinase/integrase [Chloroflexota bacterium]